MNFKNVIKAALIPAAAMMVLGVISTVISTVIAILLRGSFIISLVLGLGFLALNLLIAAYGGYRAVKKYGLDLIGAVLTGALSYGAAGIVNGILSFTLLVSGLTPLTSSASSVQGGMTMIIIGGLIGLVIGFFIAIVLGAVLGLIGGFVAEKL